MFEMYQEHEELAEAVAQSDVEKIEKLHANGVDINLRCIPVLRGITPLMYAASEGKHDVLRLLLDLGADTEEVEYYYGNTALHFAAQAGDVKSYEILRDAGADLEAQNRFSADVADICNEQLNYEETYKILEDMYKTNPQLAESLGYGNIRPPTEEQLQNWKHLRDMFLNDVGRSIGADRDIERER